MILKALKLKDNLKNLVDKFKIFNNSSGYLVLLVIFTGLVAGAGFKVFPIGSQGVDPATGLMSSTPELMQEAASNGADSFKILVYDNDPAALKASFEKAAELNKLNEFEVYLRIGTKEGQPSMTGAEFATLINSAMSQSTLNANRIFVSLYNEPEVDEPKTERYIAENWIDFYRTLSNTNIRISPYIPNVNYTGDQNGNWYQYFNNAMLKIAELGGKEAIDRINFMGINAHGDVAVDIESALAVFSLYMSNPQILLAETSPLGGTQESFELGMKLCQATQNCIGAFFFNALLANGSFNKDWDAYNQNQEAIYDLLNRFDIKNAYQGNDFKEDFILFSKYLYDPNSLTEAELARAIAFYNLMISKFAQVATNYKNLGTISKYGVSSTISSLNCGGGNMTYAYNIINSDDETFVYHAKWAAAYQLYDIGGKPVGNTIGLGGATQSSQIAPPGQQINLSPGMEDNLDHNVNYSQIQASGGSIKFLLTTEFENSAANAQNDPNRDKIIVNNECTVTILAGGQCSSTIVCTGGGPGMYCKAVNDSVRSPAPPKPNPDLEPPVMACNEQSASGENSLSLSYIRNDAPVGESHFRLGFEILNMQLAYPLADDRGENYMLKAVEFQDNTPPRIVRNLATKETKSRKDPAHIGASFSNWNLLINGQKNSMYQANTQDAGIDYLEYIFENLCYISNSQSGTASSCEKIFSDFSGQLSDLAFNYNLPNDYIQLKNDDILSCSQEYNNKEFSGKYSDNYNARGYGSYIINDFPINVNPLFADPDITTGKLEVEASANVNLAVSRINWMIESLLSLEHNFISQYFESSQTFKSYYDNCLVKYINKDGGAAKINYRFVLEERQELQCLPGQIKLDQYQWRRVKTSNVGSSYVPGLGALYLFLSHLPDEALGTRSTAGLTFRFDPKNPDSCQLQYNQFLPNIQINNN